MTNATNKFPASYNSYDGDRFVLYKADKQLVFNKSPSGLYYPDIGNREILMVSTIMGNREGCTA